MTDIIEVGDGSVDVDPRTTSIAWALAEMLYATLENLKIEESKANIPEKSAAHLAGNITRKNIEIICPGFLLKKYEDFLD